MKARYPAIALLVIIIFRGIIDEVYLSDPPSIISGLCGIAILALLCMTIYALISNGIRGLRNFIFELVDRIKR